MTNNQDENPNLNWAEYHNDNPFLLETDIFLSLPIYFYSKIISSTFILFIKESYSIIIVYINTLQSFP